MALARVVNFIGGAGNRTIGHTEVIFRLIAFGSVIGSIAIVATLATRKALAVATLGWNPLVALHFAGGGHNDAFMMLLVLVALLAAARGGLERRGCRVGGVSVRLTPAIPADLRSRTFATAQSR
jgi:hypothetical protein